MGMQERYAVLPPISPSLNAGISTFLPYVVYQHALTIFFVLFWNFRKNLIYLLISRKKILTFILFILTEYDKAGSEVYSVKFW